MSKENIIDIEIKQKSIRIKITLILGFCLTLFCGSYLFYIFSARGIGFIHIETSNNCTVIEEIGRTIQYLPYESMTLKYQEDLSLALSYHPGKLIPSACKYFEFILSQKPTSLSIILTGYDPSSQVKNNPVQNLESYFLKNDDNLYHIKIPMDHLMKLTNIEYFGNQLKEKTDSKFTFDFNFENIVRAPSYSKRVMYATLKANHSTFQRVFVHLPYGARALPFSPVSHWTPSGFRSRNPKAWQDYNDFSLLKNDNQTNFSIAYDFPRIERFEKTLLMILSTLFGVGISAMIEAFLSLGTARLVGVLAQSQEEHQQNNTTVTKANTLSNTFEKDNISENVLNRDTEKPKRTE